MGDRDRKRRNGETGDIADSDEEEETPVTRKEIRDMMNQQTELKDLIVKQNTDFMEFMRGVANDARVAKDAVAELDKRVPTKEQRRQEIRDEIRVCMDAGSAASTAASEAPAPVTPVAQPPVREQGGHSGFTPFGQGKVNGEDKDKDNHKHRDEDESEGDGEDEDKDEGMDEGEDDAAVEREGEGEDEDQKDDDDEDEDKARGAKVMTKGDLAKALAHEHGMDKSECAKILDSLAFIGASEVMKAGKFAIPGLCIIKARKKPATKEMTREINGKMRKLAAKPAKTVLKSYTVAALKKLF